MQFVGCGGCGANLHIVALLLLLQVSVWRLGIEAFAPASSEHSIGDNFNVPCKYMDSIATADLQRYDLQVGGHGHAANTSGHLIVGQFDYAIINQQRHPVARHERQCVCRHRPCVRLRCARGQTFDENSGACTDDARVRDLRMPIVGGVDGDVKTTMVVSVFDYFGYTVGKACAQMTPLVPEEFASDAWEMNALGEVVRPKETLNQHQYSMEVRWNNETEKPEIVILMCFEDYVNLNRFEYLPYGMILSVPFLLLTILVYALLPELRNVNGKSLMCYLASLAAGYALLAFLQLRPGTDNWWCRPFGYLMYFWFLAAFLWLNVISFELWWTFRDFKGRKLQGSRKFALYSAYAWGVPLAATLASFGLDSVAWAPSYIQPGIGLSSACFFKPNRWIRFYYFNLPILLIFVSNVIFFTLTTIKIRRVQLEMAKITSKEESRRHRSQFDQEKDKFGMFLRLFIVMGVTWLMESISFLFDPAGWVFIVTDVLNCCQGLVIFVLFVMKPKVKRLLMKRFSCVPLIRNMSMVSNIDADIPPTPTTEMQSTMTIVQ